GRSAWVLTGTSPVAALARKAFVARGFTVRDYPGALTVAAELPGEELDALARRIE
ncbi:MAG: hypothetical protein H0W15_00475, partial [Gemmatimonadales bacterium]|nr:hypothetical protein [Gemmatimonadales bacterium]